jgi:hypothetical protein
VNFALSSRAAAFVLVSAMAVQGIWNRSLADSPPPGRPVVVELFTSQGCSSCPPADAILGELATQGSVIALGFHVDYWDGIGWRDRYSMPQATERQRRYVEALKLSSAFTPQMVIDGRRSIVGSDRARIAAAIVETPGAVAVEASIAQDHLAIALPDSEDRRRYDVNIVAYLQQATTKVGNGENAGKTLTEFNLVRQFRQVGTWDGKASTFQIPLKSLPNDATHVAVLIQQANEGPIAGAIAVKLH